MTDWHGVNGGVDGLVKIIVTMFRQQKSAPQPLDVRCAAMLIDIRSAKISGPKATAFADLLIEREGRDRETIAGD